MRKKYFFKTTIQALFLLMLISFGRTALAGIPGEQAEAAGRKRLSSHDCEGARQAFRAALDAFETSSRHLLLARALKCLDRPQEAYRHAYLASAARGSNDRESLKLLLDLCLRLGKNKQARSILNQLRGFPGLAGFVSRRASVLRFRSGEINRALSLARAAVGDRFTKWDRRALCLYSLESKRIKAALEHCPEAVRSGALGAEWLARTLAKAGRLDLAAGILWHHGKNANKKKNRNVLDSRYRARLAYLYFKRYGDLYHASRALEYFSRLGGDVAPGDYASVARRANMSFDYSRGTGRARQGKYDYYGYGLKLDVAVPMPGRWKLVPGAELENLGEDATLSGPGEPVRRSWQEGRAVMSLKAELYWPEFGLRAALGGGGYFSSDSAYPLFELNVSGRPKAGWIDLDFSLSYGLGKRAASASYSCGGLEAELRALLRAGPVQVLGGLRNMLFAFEHGRPRQLSGFLSGTWPLGTGLFQFSPGLAISLDRSWDQPLGGVPVDLSSNREALWLVFSVSTVKLNYIDFNMNVSWAPVSRGYSMEGNGLEPFGNGPWRIESRLRIRSRQRAGLELRTWFDDELRKRNVFAYFGIFMIL
ncbi:MAG: hypothetical protein GXP49_04795 [Deltaproteobacteria bacterium]|nr:hypothetical protein [Deltaproteobacteria bacterium]